MSEKSDNEELHKQIARAIASDPLKRPSVPFDTFGKELIQRFIKNSSNINLESLLINVVFDIGLLVALLKYGKRDDGTAIKIENVLFTCYTIEQSEFSKSLDVNVRNIRCEKYLQETTEMKFDVIIGNPPYNGVEKHVGYEDVHNSGKQPSYYQFLKKASLSLSDGGTMLTITPSEFLKGKQGSKCREYLLSNVSIKSTQFLDEPFEGVGVGECVVLSCKKDSFVKHDVETFQGMILRCDTEIEKSIVKKVHDKLKDHEPVKFWRGSVSEDENGKHSSYVTRFNRGSDEVKIIQSQCSTNKETHDAIMNHNDIEFILFNEFVGQQYNTFKRHKCVVKPQPFHDSLLCVPSRHPSRHIALLESNLIRYYHSRIFTITHIGSSLQGFCPDVTNDLQDQANEDDVENVFGLTIEESFFVRDYIQNVYERMKNEDC